MSVQRKKRFAIVNKKQCVACGSCMKACPRKVIDVPQGIFAEVKLEKCVGCGLCAKACPASVIHIVTKEYKEDVADEKQKQRVV